ncbi:MAG: septal ring lytic transglycosylase RlpA family protein [Candidatus Competibacteraceae bacterium]|nr:septal ring lytic transglycosylase RlpA family protein [Candidatus Competibacteraceae bacterium]
MNTHASNSRFTRKGRAYFLPALLVGALALSVGIPATVHAAGGQVGKASWYGPGFHGKKTASGQRFNQNQMTAAHRSLPLGSRARVTNLRNGKAIDVTINDRGPFVKGRVIDLSRAAARRLAISGLAPVRVTSIP